MALNFPDSPTLNQVYTDTTSGFSYKWDGVVWQSYSAPASKNISIVDNIESSFNGVTQTFPLAVSGTALTPANAQQLRVVLGGIVQEPLTDYTVSGSNITFTTAPTAGLDCSIVSLGPAVSVSVPGDGTVTPVKLSTGGPYWNTGGDVVITGVGTTALLVNGNARVTGILTVGSSSITLDGTNNTINVGSLSISQGGISGGTPNINVGFITATGASISGSVTVGGNVSIAGTLTYEDVTNVDSVGLVTARAGVNVTGGSVVVGSAVTLSSGGINVAGVVTATSFIGNGSQLTGIDSTALKDSGGNVKVQANPSGAVVTGVLTATSFSGNVTGNVTGTAGGLSGSPNITVGTVSATSFSVSGTAVVDSSRNLTNIANATTAATANTYVLRGADGKICSNSLSNLLARGSSCQGGFLMCSYANVHWIVAPISAEVSRCFALTGDANTRAQQVSGCTGWFVPNLNQLQQPGYAFRVYWDTTSNSKYFSTCNAGSYLCGIDFRSGAPFNTVFGVEPNCVRSFRCVSY